MVMATRHPRLSLPSYPDPEIRQELFQKTGAADAPVGRIQGSARTRSVAEPILFLVMRLGRRHRCRMGTGFQAAIAGRAFLL